LFVGDYCELNGITFAWNREKAWGNLSKHGVAFQQAVKAFFDPFARVIDASPEEEARDAVPHWSDMKRKAHV
jgi:uncharacterized DUF497 family protein